MGSRYRNRCCGAAAVALLGSAAAAINPSFDRLTDLSLEDLSNIEITSVSKRAERLSDAPASVFVITADDIRRSGADQPARGAAPGAQSAGGSRQRQRMGDQRRGFNSRSANKLLVLIDGRSVYSPLFSGVFWDVQDLMLEDVERIEVISGPGGTLWGVNAVNGVINVITRPSGQTQGRSPVARGRQPGGTDGAAPGRRTGRKRPLPDLCQADAAVLTPKRKTAGPSMMPRTPRSSDFGPTGRMGRTGSRSRATPTTASASSRCRAPSASLASTLRSARSRSRAQIS